MIEQLMEKSLKQYLYPFYGTFVLFFLMYPPLLGYPPVTFTAALFKVLPIWSLAYFVYSTANSNVVVLMDKDYKKFIFLGLLTSSLGDAFLVAREVLFMPGVLAFSVAHAFYILALEPSSGPSRLKNLYILGYIAVALTLQSGIDNLFMFFLVMIYLTLIITMSWRATNAHERHGTFQTYAACIGSLLFVLSDLLIAVDKWKFYIPFGNFLIMMTYYSSQFFIALSTDD